MQTTLIYRSSRYAIVAALSMLATACVSMQASAPFPAAAHITLERKLPDELPEHSSPFPNSQFVLIPQDSAVGMVVPLPFVTDVVLDSVHGREAASLAQRYARIDPYSIVEQAMAGSPLMAPGGLPTQPFAYMVDCKDQRYRMALVARVRDKEWIGRYLVHLTKNYSADDIANGRPEVLEVMGKELADAAAVLRAMMEKDASGALSRPLYHADIGSFDLACSDVSGLLPATLLLARNAAVVEEDEQHIIFRAIGDLRQPGSSGGLIFGLHYLHKDQLHTFKRLPDK